MWLQIVLIMMKVTGEHANVTALYESNVYDITIFVLKILKCKFTTYYFCNFVVDV